MSSHHFVKEKQEPALIIESLAAFDKEYLGQLLEWNPTILCSEKSFSELASQQIKVDILFSNTELPLVTQSDLKRELYEGSFIDTALCHLVRHDYHAVNIVGNDFDLPKLLPYAATINLIVYQGKMRSFTVRSGFKKWKPAHSTIQIQDLPTLKVEGLERVAAGNYRTRKDGFYGIEFEQGHIFISEEI